MVNKQKLTRILPKYLSNVSNMHKQQQDLSGSTTTTTTCMYVCMYICMQVGMLDWCSGRGGRLVLRQGWQIGVTTTTIYVCMYVSIYVCKQQQTTITYMYVCMCNGRDVRLLFWQGWQIVALVGMVTQITNYTYLPLQYIPF